MKAFALIAAAAVLTAGAAHAEMPKEEITFAYRFDRAQLATAEGVEAVYRDLVSEARRACTVPGGRGIAVVDEACVAELVAKVVTMTGSAMLETRSAAAQPADQVVIASR